MVGLYVFVGGGVGAVLRYLFSGVATRMLGVNFPFGTVLVNIIGCFFMGVLVEYFSRTLPHSMELRAFLVVGVLGGFTTFSAFSLDAIMLLERGQMGLAVAYILASVVFSLLAVLFGMFLLRVL